MAIEPSASFWPPFPSSSIRYEYSRTMIGTAVPVTVREYSYLMDEDGKGGQKLAEGSMAIKSCYAEPLLKAAKPGERFQFFRHGYYIADAKLTEAEEGGAKVFNQIVGLKSSWNKQE